MTSQGETYTSSQIFKDNSRALFDPNITINVIDPNGNPVLTGQTPIKDSTGKYHYNYTFPNDADIGIWTIQWNLGDIEIGNPVNLIDNTYIVTVNEVKNTAKRRGVVILTYDDDHIQYLIEEAQDYIEGMTNRVFNKQSTDGNPEMHFSTSGDSIICNHAPIISVEKVTIDGNPVQNLVSGQSRIDYENGIIYLSPNVPTALGYPLYELYPGFSAWSSYPYDAGIEYTFGYDPAHKEAVKLCLDYVIEKIRNYRRDKGGDDSWLQPIDKRLAKLRKPFVMLV